MGCHFSKKLIESELKKYRFEGSDVYIFERIGRRNEPVEEHYTFYGLLNGRTLEEFAEDQLNQRADEDNELYF